MTLPQDIFEACVTRAALAPTIHNTQPARWIRDGDVLSLFCDTDVGLPVADPDGRGAALSCGAVLEAMVLALSAVGFGAAVSLIEAGTAPGQGLVAVAHLRIDAGETDGLNTNLERRFTWRGAFSDAGVDLFGWTRADTRLVVDGPNRAWLAERNDAASLAILQNAEFRRELVSWMRLSEGHPRAGVDGMDRAALRMTARQARFVPFVLRRLWPILHRFGRADAFAREAELTLTAPLIALFHKDNRESFVAAGRSYMRLCLEAASLGLAGWPMAALSDDADARREICARFGIPPDRSLVQAIRFGVPTGTRPPRARRPLSEVLR